MLLTRFKPLRLLVGFAETVNWVSLRLWTRDRVAARSYHGCAYRTFMRFYRNGRWRSRSFHELFPDSGRLQVIVEHHPEDGIYTAVDELTYLALLTRVIEPQVIFEIGTFRGRTALNFALNAPTDAIIYTMDLPYEERSSFCKAANPADAAIIQASRTGELFRDRPEASRIRQLFGNSMVFDFHPYHGQADMVFVDGAHHYRAARQDTLSALALAKVGGWVIWHDFANYGDYADVTRAVLDELPGDQVYQIADTQLALYRKTGSERLPAS